MRRLYRQEGQLPAFFSHENTHTKASSSQEGESHTKTLQALSRREGSRFVLTQNTKPQIGVGVLVNSNPNLRFWVNELEVSDELQLQSVEDEPTWNQVVVNLFQLQPSTLVKGQIQERTGDCPRRPFSNDFRRPKKTGKALAEPQICIGSGRSLWRTRFRRVFRPQMNPSNLKVAICSPGLCYVSLCESHPQKKR